MRLRSELDALRAENETLRQRLAQYESAPVTDPDHVRAAIAKAYAALPEVTSSDWVASYYVLTTHAKAPQQFAAFARWVNALKPDEFPNCTRDHVRRDGDIYTQPIFEWENYSLQSDALKRRTAIAKRLRTLLYGK